MPTHRRFLQFEGHTFNYHKGLTQATVVALRLCVRISLYAPNCPTGRDNEFLAYKKTFRLSLFLQ